MKKIFMTVLFIGLAIFLSMGCITKDVLRTQYDYSSYKEQIISFYLNPKGDEVAFIGKKYHYIFNKGTKEFIELLKNREALELEQSNLKINTRVEDNTLVHSDIAVRFIDRGLTQKQRLWFQTHKFMQIRGRKETSYVKNYHIIGNRYLSNPNVNAKVERLKHTLEVEIVEMHVKSGDTIRKIVMTPIAVAGDTILIAGGTVLAVGGAVLLLPVAILSNAVK